MQVDEQMEGEDGDLIDDQEPEYPDDGVSADDEEPVDRPED